MRMDLRYLNYSRMEIRKLRSRINGMLVMGEIATSFEMDNTIVVKCTNTGQWDNHYFYSLVGKSINYEFIDTNLRSKDAIVLFGCPMYLKKARQGRRNFMIITLSQTI